jgi:hypothetical protein
VIGEGEPVETALARTVDQLLQRTLAVVREVRVKVEVDAQHPRGVRPSRLL